MEKEGRRCSIRNEEDETVEQRYAHAHMLTTMKGLEVARKGRGNEASKQQRNSETTTKMIIKHRWIERNVLTAPTLSNQHFCHFAGWSPRVVVIVAAAAAVGVCAEDYCTKWYLERDFRLTPSRLRSFSISIFLSSFVFFLSFSTSFFQFLAASLSLTLCSVCCSFCGFSIPTSVTFHFAICFPTFSKIFGRIKRK